MTSVAVIGCGNMGSNHVRILKELGCDVVTVDPSPSSGAMFTNQVSSPLVDYVVVATPIEQLAKETEVALIRKSHVLVEKPVALDVRTAEHLRGVAKLADRNLYVGYTECFNPAVDALRSILRADQIQYALATRKGLQAPEKSPGAFLDLAVHDLAVLDSMGFRARERIIFADRIVLDEVSTCVILDACYGTEKVRTLHVESSLGEFKLDYAAQTLEHDGRSIEVEKAEPLRLELEALLSGEGVSIDAGIRILQSLTA